MPRYSAGVRTGAGSTTLPIASLYATAAVSFRLFEIAVSNTTATVVALKLVKLTTTGTQGAGLTETGHAGSFTAASCTAFTTHSVAPTMVDMGYNVCSAAAIGPIAIWTFDGVSVPLGTGNGVGIVPAVGTGQVCDVSFTWEEGV